MTTLDHRVLLSRVRALREAGLSVSEVAESLGYSLRHAQRLVSELEPGTARARQLEGQAKATSKATAVRRARARAERRERAKRSVLP